MFGLRHLNHFATGSLELLWHSTDFLHMFGCLLALHCLSLLALLGLSLLMLLHQECLMLLIPQI